jgi:hypothetical protein
MMFKFWDVVVECLVEFHHLDYAQVHQEVVELRGRLRKSDRLVMAQNYNGSPGPATHPHSLKREQPGDVVRPSDIVYHEEPFYLACDLMNRQLKIEEYIREIQHYS